MCEKVHHGFYTDRVFIELSLPESLRDGAKVESISRRVKAIEANYLTLRFVQIILLCQNNDSSSKAKVNYGYHIYWTFINKINNFSNIFFASTIRCYYQFTFGTGSGCVWNNV
jgi:acetyltransferase-like isoleucine patch superfamily enzyme